MKLLFFTNEGMFPLFTHLSADYYCHHSVISRDHICRFQNESQMADYQPFPVNYNISPCEIAKFSNFKAIQNRRNNIYYLNFWYNNEKFLKWVIYIPVVCIVQIIFCITFSSAVDIVQIQHSQRCIFINLSSLKIRNLSSLHQVWKMILLRGCSSSWIQNI
jgi:hypothetical protein